MTHADIPLPTAVRTLVDLLLQAVGRGLRVLMQRYGAPDEARRSNAGAFADLSYGFTVVRRLARILRYALVILALRVVPVDLPPVVSRASLRSGERTRCASFALTARWPSIFESGRVQPPHLARGASNRLDTLARKMEALSRALRNTMPLIRRLARSLARDVVVIGWRPPKRAPRRRDFWDELLNARSGQLRPQQLATTRGLKLILRRTAALKKPRERNATRARYDPPLSLRHRSSSCSSVR